MALIFSERVQSQNLEAEQAVIGACLVSNVGRATIVQVLKPDDFYAAKHTDIYRAVLDLDESGDVNPLTVHDRLKAKGILDEVGGLEYLFTCVNSCVIPNAPDALVSIVKEKSKRRQLKRALAVANQNVDDETYPYDEVQAKAEEVVLAVRDAPKVTITPEEWGYAFEAECVISESGGEARRRILTGIKDIDERLNMWPGRLTTVAGDTGIGKSVFSVKVAREAGLRLKQRVYVWLGEMDKNEFWERVCAAELNLDYEKVQRRTLPSRDAARVREWMVNVYQHSNIIVRDAFEDGVSTIADIRADCRYIAAKDGPIDIIIIDYLLLLGDLTSAVEGSDRRDIRIGNIVWNLIQMAKELQCHVLLVHQFNRGKSLRPMGRPRLSDLKESSAIEQHSYNVLLLYRPDSDESLDPDERDVFRGWFEINIAKARGGKKGNVWMEFRGNVQELSAKHKPWPGDGFGPALPFPGMMTAEKRAKEKRR